MTSRSSEQAKAWLSVAKPTLTRARVMVCLMAAAALSLSGTSILAQLAGRESAIAPTTLPKTGPATSASSAPSSSPSLTPSTGPSTLPSTRGAQAVTRPTINLTTLPSIPRPVVETHPKPPELSYATPDSLDELRSLERNVEEISLKVIPATVCLQIGQASGSGVIVSPEGWILTAGHVSGEAGVPVVIVLHDGRKIKGVTYGANNNVDSGLVRITDPMPAGGWPVASMGTSHDLQVGQWLIAIGHPGGYKYGRAPVVRLGRLVGVAGDGNTLTTDNTLVGGDSGGPLYDLDGRVVGIHSRIAPSVTDNMHVPVDAFVKDWDKISIGDVWGNLGGSPPRIPQMARAPYFGIKPENIPNDGGVRVKELLSGSPAEKAGLRTGDVIVEADGKQVKNFLNFLVSYNNKKAGDVLKVKVKREGSEGLVDVAVTLGEPQTATRPSPKPSTNPSTLPSAGPSTQPSAGPSTHPTEPKP